MDGLSIMIELLNGGPKSPRSSDNLDLFITHHWQLTVLSDGTTFPRGVVSRRCIFALKSLRWKESAEIPFATADGYHGIVDIQSILVEAELRETNRGNVIVVLLDHPMKEVTIALPIF